MTASGPAIRLLPRLDLDNRFYWTGGADGRLRLLRCADCRRYVHPPAPVCPDCLNSDLAPEEVSGRGTVVSYTVNHQQWIPGSDVYVIAWVAIEEQPDVRLTTNLVGVGENEVEIGMPVHVVFENAGEDIYLPLFAPGSTSSSPDETAESGGAA